MHGLNPVPMSSRYVTSERMRIFHLSLVTRHSIRECGKQVINVVIYDMNTEQAGSKLISFQAGPTRRPSPKFG